MQDEALHVFVGPSLEREVVAAALPAARIEPPIARGDLARLRGEGATTFLILDGAFLHRLAVAPSEIVDAIAGGARVIGAASLGAIRAAECWPAGMEGIGAVHRLYRLGVLRDDDEVAVATDPESDFAAISIALVSVRYAMLAALRAGALDRGRAAAVLGAARGLHFAERRWETIFARAGLEVDPDVRMLCERTDIKRRDAVAAVAAIGSSPGAGGVGGRLAPWRTPGLLTGQVRPTRYPGHDPLFGHSLPELRQQLACWLLDSGRSRRYLGPGVAAGANFETHIWAKLETEGELARELMHYYAARRLSA